MSCDRRNDKESNTFNSGGASTLIFGTRGAGTSPPVAPNSPLLALVRLVSASNRSFEPSSRTGSYAKPLFNFASGLASSATNLNLYPPTCCLIPRQHREISPCVTLSAFAASNPCWQGDPGAAFRIHRRKR